MSNQRRGLKCWMKKKELNKSITWTEVRSKDVLILALGISGERAKDNCRGNSITYNVDSELQFRVCHSEVLADCFLEVLCCDYNQLKRI